MPKAVVACKALRTGKPMLQLAAYLHGRGISAMSYHAGLSAAARQEVSDSLRCGRVSVVTCTTALSTGLDCSRVDGVLHYSLPPSLEEYVQQVCPSRLDPRGVPLCARPDPRNGFPLMCCSTSLFMAGNT